MLKLGGESPIIWHRPAEQPIHLCRMALPAPQRHPERRLRDSVEGTVTVSRRDPSTSLGMTGSLFRDYQTHFYLRNVRLDCQRGCDEVV
jgi:hypothetical protein